MGHAGPAERIAIVEGIPGNCCRQWLAITFNNGNTEGNQTREEWDEGAAQSNDSGKMDLDV